VGLKSFIQKHQEYARKHPYYSYPRCIPSKTSSLIPVIKEVHKITALNDQCLKHIITTNSGLNQGSTIMLAVSSTEVNALSTLFGHLKAQTDYNLLEFTSATLDILEKMVHWPHDKIFAVVDVVRVAILHKKAAEYYISKPTESSIFLFLFNILLTPNLCYANCFVLLKFIINLFFQECLHVIITNHSEQIIDAVTQVISNNMAGYQPKQATTIMSLVVQLISNFAFFWTKKKSMDLASHKNITSGTISLLQAILHDHKDKALSPGRTLEEKRADEDVITTCLASIGTILVEDGCCKVEPRYFQHWLTYPNPKIQEVAEYIVHLVDCKLEMAELNR